MVEDDGSIAGSIPIFLLNGEHASYGFASIEDQIRSRLTSASFATSTNPSYISFCYDILTNLTLNYQHSRIVLNRGLALDDNSKRKIGIRCKNDSPLFQSVDSTQMVKNLCSSQKYHKMDLFLTFTCNQKEHFGIKHIREWIDSQEWQNHFIGFKSLFEHEKIEIKNALEQSSSGLFLRNWMEVRELFLDYLLQSKSSPLHNVSDLFARDEYQSDSGNLPHIHSMCKIDWDKLTNAQKSELDDLVRASIIDIIRYDEIDAMIEKGIFTSFNDIFDIQEKARIILPHFCNKRCMRRISVGDGPESFVCRKPNNVKLSPDNTKHCFLNLPTNFSNDCKNILQRIGLMEQLENNEFDYESENKFYHEFFKPKRHIPPTNPTLDPNMSPVIGELFSATKSMQNAQVLTQTNGCNKYLCKYIAKVDEQNQIIISSSTHKMGTLKSNTEFVYNTKISSSKKMKKTESITKDITNILVVVKSV